MLPRRIYTILFVLLICLSSTSPALSGGWAVITLEKLPDNVVAGEPFQVSFRARQHGQRFVDDLSPRVIASHTETGEEVIVSAAPGEKAGQYTAELILPEPGTWRWSIKAWHQPRMPDLHVAAKYAPAALSHNKLLALLTGTLVLFTAGLFLALRPRISSPKAAFLASLCVVIAGMSLASLRSDASTSSSASPSEQRSQVEIGHDLFIAKGCLTCHVNDRIEPRYISFSSQIGPNLKDYPTSAEYLRVWLKDPASLKPATQMPNLELTEDEIEALIAFLLTSE